VAYNFQWDILSNGGLVQEMAHIANGRDPGNCVSLLRVNVSLDRCYICIENMCILENILSSCFVLSDCGKLSRSVLA